jgi:hypothetical protein
VDKNKNRCPSGLVERYKGPRPLDHDVVLAKLIRRGRKTIRTDELRKLFGYGPEATDDAVRRRNADLNKYAAERYGVSLESTAHKRLYRIKDLPARRKKAGGSFDPST